MAGTLTPVVDVPAHGQLVALPGGGYAVAAPSEEGDAILIQPYDSIGRATGQPIVAASALPENWQLDTFGVSSDGSSFVVVWSGHEWDDDGIVIQEASYTAQVVSANGQPIGDQVELDTPNADLLRYAEGFSVEATSDGGFLILGMHKEWHYQDTIMFFNRLSQTGEQIGAATVLGINLREDSYSVPRLDTAVHNGEVVVISHSAAEGGAVLRRFDEAGEPIAEPVILHYTRPEGSESYSFAGMERLSSGDLLISWNNFGYGGKFGPGSPISTSFQRLNADGSPIGEMITTGRASGVAALQDGGFVVLQDTSYQEGPSFYPGDNWLHVFDRNNQAVGEPGSANGGTRLVAQADGTIVLTGTDGTYVFDYAPSHTAEWGGKQAYIETWQDQELLSRDDGVEMLRSNAGVAMKSWIVNFEAASDEDGINATANAMANHLLGGNGANVFIAGAGNDKLYGLGGNDWLLGENGNDLLDGGDGHDVLIGGLGNDSVAAGAGADTVAGDDGDDAIGGGAGRDIVQGGTGRDFVSGDAGNDTLSGGAGRDWVNGGSGDDVVSGDRGADTLEGGSGADQFRFGASSGNDIILDFEYGAAGDRIVIDLPADGTINGLTVDAAAALFDAAEDTGDGVLIGLGDGHSILLAGLVKADLGADMFVLV